MFSTRCTNARYLLVQTANGKCNWRCTAEDGSMGDEFRNAKLQAYLQQQLGSSILPVQSEVDRAIEQGDLLNMAALQGRLAVQLARLAKAIYDQTAKGQGTLRNANPAGFFRLP